jgi:hypothetical protein
MKNFKNKTLPVLTVMITVVLLAGCASTGKVKAPTSELLRYKFNQGETYKYRQSSEMNQIMEYMGQEIGATVSSTFGFEINPGEKVEGVSSLGITIDTMGVTVKSMQGDFVTPSKELIGKQLTIKLSETGVESELEEAAAIKYLIAGQESNLKSSFSMFFPDLPTEGVMVGYTWTQTDTVDLSAGTESATMIITSNNTISGRETMNGYDCYVISSTVSGVRDAVSNTGQGSISSTGNISGSGTTHFAPSEGILVKDVANSKIDGSILIPTGESLPLFIEVGYTTELVK